MAFDGEREYEDYLQKEVGIYEADSKERRKRLAEAIAGLEITRVLDVGCGAGQEMLPFAEGGAELCIGVDAAAAAGKVFKNLYKDRGCKERVVFIAAAGEELPFSPECFDLIICRVALPYMNSKKALCEMARVMRSGGRLALTIHTPGFYVRMVSERLRTLNPKQLAYPVICFAGGLWFMASGQQPQDGFWKGKETFHTKRMLLRELEPAGLRIESEMPADGEGGRTFVIVKD